MAWIARCRCMGMSSRSDAHADSMRASTCCAVSRTTGTSLTVAAITRTRSSSSAFGLVASALLAITSAFLRSIATLARFPADGPNTRDRSCSVQPRISSIGSRDRTPESSEYAAFTRPSNIASPSCRRLNGQTSWQTSHPMRRLPTPACSDASITPRRSSVRYDTHRVASTL